MGLMQVWKPSEARSFLKKEEIYWNGKEKKQHVYSSLVFLKEKKQKSISWSVFSYSTSLAGQDSEDSANGGRMRYFTCLLWQEN